MNIVNCNPDWMAAPAWAAWWACDQDGDAFWYECEPARQGRYWSKQSGQKMLAGMANTHLVDWRTLVRRPGTTETSVKLRSMTMFEIYAFLKPPLELVQHLERYELRGELPAPVLEYLNMWRTIRSDYTFALDGVTIEQPATAHVGELERVLA